MSSPTNSQVYTSTRDSEGKKLSFEDVVIAGLAPDGGLYIPPEIPSLGSNFFSELKDKSFQDLAFTIMRCYISASEISDSELRQLIEKSYATFRAPDVTPTVPINKQDNLYLLELFHGPTYAFKDVALQFVGNLFEFFLTRRNQNLPEDAEKASVTVVGATSGDTGSAAIYGLRNKQNVSVFILYPTGRISPIQEAQMTTVLDDNVRTLSVNGTFDDCQDIVKAIFADTEFNKKYHVGAVNSINWARILAQITYYFYSFFQLCKTENISEADLQSGEKKIKFVVPSGNFGDILAGFFAKRMGLPISKLVIATNSNDILNRFVKSGVYERITGSDGDVKATLSPAMDILISSNFERLLWYLAKENLSGNPGATLAGWMTELKTKNSFKVPEAVLTAARAEFASEMVSDEETLKTIKAIYDSTEPKYILDPHSAVGITAAQRGIAADKAAGAKGVYYISLSTAHPAKFADAVDAALKGTPGYSFERDVLPEELRKLGDLPKKIKRVERADAELIKEIIAKELA